jgi:hypothetical protein
MMPVRHWYWLLRYRMRELWDAYVRLWERP